MSKLKKLSGNIVLGDEIIPGTIFFEEVINKIIFEKNISYKNYIVPGFVDLHVHGGKGHDSMEGLNSITKMSDYHLSHGTTTIYPTTVAASFDDTLKALKGLGNYIKDNNKTTNIDGVHLEGPFINPKKMGAQPPFAQLPNNDFIEKLMEEVPVKIMTLSPEIHEGIDLVNFLIKNKIKPQIGHSLANFNTCKIAIKNGVESFTHLYNAMSGFDHRNPGVVAAAFSKATFAEIICDLVHVNKEMIKLAANNIKKIYSISDCISGSGMPDGEYKLGTYKVVKKNGVVKLNNNTLGGSIVTMDKTFINLINIGFSIQDSVKMTSTNACEYMGYNDIGYLDKDNKANLLNLDEKFNLKEVFLKGNKVR